ncbi:hypothetical protein QYM36_003186 [Artemia franciscana]|uniref:Uncharacterized protein n=1 Tax=Artemia franciscana TaxID=6661 RepID=A0AA88I9G0_ARTSF|nr:hypothetical protein QYM36_003186 [Artemia franciscana]
MKCATGQDPKYWETLQKPNWWPTDVPFSQKIIYPSLAISDINQDYHLAYRQTSTILIGTLPGMPTQLLTPSSFISPHLQRRIVTASIPPSGSVPEIQSVPHLQPSSQSRLLEQRKVNGKLPSELPSSLFNALSTSLEEVKKWADDNIRLMKDFEGEEPMEFLSEALTRTRNAVKKLKDVNMTVLKAPKRRADSIDIGQRKESFFSKSSAAVGKETASTSNETSSDLQIPLLVESGRSKSSSQSSLQNFKTGVTKGEPLKEKTHVGKNLVELMARSVELTPLHYALQEGQTSVVHYLLEKRANPVNLSHLFFQDRVNSSDLGLTPGASSDEDPPLVIDEQPGGAVLRPYDVPLFKNSFCPALC